jgi:hypothetical protein
LNLNVYVKEIHNICYFVIAPWAWLAEQELDRGSVAQELQKRHKKIYKKDILNPSECLLEKFVVAKSAPYEEEEEQEERRRRRRK